MLFRTLEIHVWVVDTNPCRCSMQQGKPMMSQLDSHSQESGVWTQRQPVTFSLWLENRWRKLKQWGSNQRKIVWRKKRNRCAVLRERRGRNREGTLSVFPMAFQVFVLDLSEAWLSASPWVLWISPVPLEYSFPSIKLAQVDFFYCQPNRSQFRHSVSVKLKSLWRLDPLLLFKGEIENISEIENNLL